LKSVGCAERFAWDSLLEEVGVLGPRLLRLYSLLLCVIILVQGIGALDILNLVL
jgi:hypothetical protein